MSLDLEGRVATVIECLPRDQIAHDRFGHRLPVKSHDVDRRFRYLDEGEVGGTIG